MQTNWIHSPASNRTSISCSLPTPFPPAIDSIPALHHQTHDGFRLRMWFGSFRTMDKFHCWACDKARTRINWRPHHCDIRPCNWWTNTIAWHSIFSRRALDIGERELAGCEHQQCCTCSREWHSTRLSFSDSTSWFLHYHQGNRTHHGWTHENRSYWKTSCGNHGLVDSALRWCRFGDRSLSHVAASAIDFAKFSWCTEKTKVNLELDNHGSSRFYERVKVIRFQAVIVEWTANAFGCIDRLEESFASGHRALPFAHM